MGTMVPVISAIGMKNVGEIESSGGYQRPIIRDDVTITINSFAIKLWILS